MLAVKKNILAINFFSLGSVQVINTGLQLLVIPYVIRVIGADGFGIVAVAQVVMNYLSTFTDYGFYQTATRQVALNRDNPQEISKIYSRVLLTKMLLCLVALGLLLVLLLIVPFFRAHFVLYLMAFSFVVGQSMLQNWLFQGLEKMWFIVLATLAGRILFVALVFLFIKHKEDDLYYIFFMGAGNILAGVTGILIAARVFKIAFMKTGVFGIRKELKEGWQYTITNLSMNTCQYANIFVLRIFTNDLVVGYFSIAEKIFFALKQVLVVFSQSTYPGICRFVEKGKGRLSAFLQKVYVPFFLSVVAGSLLLAFFSPEVLFFFSGKEAVHSVFILRMLCLVLVIVCLNIPSALLLLARNQKKEYFRIFTLGGILNILSNILFAGFFQSTGTLVAIFITEIFITAGVIYESRKSALPGNMMPV